MANESPSASWHPALMPESHPFPPSSARPTSPPEQTPPTEPEEPTRVEAEEAPSALTDAGPSDRGSVSDGDAWLEPDDVHPEASIAPAESQAPDQLSGSEIQEPEHEVTSLHLQDTGREKVADAWLIEEDDAGAADAWLVPDDANTSASVAPAESQTLEQLPAERPENELQDSRREATVDNCLSDEGDASAADAWLVPDDANTITPVVPQAFGQHPGEGPDHNLQDPRCEAIAHTCLSEERDAGAADAQLVPDNANTVAPAQSQALGQPPGEGPEHESQESGRKNTADAWLSEEGDASAPSAWLVSDDANLSMSIAPMQPQTPSHQPGDGPKHEAALPHLHGLGRENVAEAWLSEEGDASAVDAWITPDDAHPSASIAPQESVALDPLPDVETQEPEDEAAPPQPQDAGREAITDAQEPELPGLQMVTKEASSQPAHSQHSSSMSFARTVSHEVSFVDEDDAEWNLTRLGSDGSGSMPQLDPTASFQDVPPMPTSEENGSPQIPSAQAVQVIQEIERDTEMDEQPHLAARSQGQEPKPPVAQPEHAVELQSVAQAMDSEMQGSEAQDLEARYQEGVSFISDCDAKNNDTAAFADSFANEDVNDDFAQKLEPGVRAHEAESEVPPMERKSTTQAMGDLDSEPRSRFSTSNHTAGDPVTRSEESLNQSTACDAAGSSDLREDRDKVQPATEEDLTSKWQAAFAEDENDFLADDSAAGAEIHAAAFLGSDDEGLLDDDDLLDHDALSSAPAVSEARQPSESSPYIPSAVTSPQSSLPRAPLATSPLSNYPYQQPPPLVPFNSPQSQGQAAESRPQQPRVSSFADKSKGGCSSPYDLPTDLLSNTLKPRKRASMQQLPREQAPPPRSTSMFDSGQSPAAGSLPSAPPSQGPGPSQKVPSHPSQAQSSFFQDLPITAKPRPSSRQSTTSQSSSPYAPGGQHLHPAPPLASPLSPPGPRSHTQPPGVGNLVAPEKVDPYAAIASAAASAAPPANVTSGYSLVTPQQAPSMGATPPAASTRYSPAPHAAVSPPSVDTTSRYSPASLQRPVSYGAPQSSAASSRYSSAPPGPRPGSSHAPATPAASAAPSQAAMPHMPRTSSPLAHYEAASEQLHRGANANGDAHADRRAISFDHRLNRVSSLPPTREVDEEDDDQMSHTYRSLDATLAKRPATIESKMAPAYRPAAPRKTPPPQSRSYGPPASSPQRASFGYMPQTTSAAHPGLVPPPRSSTQSPVAAQGGQQISTNFKSPPSAYEPAAPAIPKQAQPLQPTGTRKRGPSLSMNLVPPTEGTEHDPLQRCKGAPILSWRVGGTMATSFPKSATRYAMNQAAPTIQRTAGEVKVQNVRDVDPLADRLARFPGPLKGKSKKKEALAWLAAGIDAQERDIPDVPLHSQLSLEAKRGVERLLLWKLLRVFIEFDGALEGNANVEKAVRDVLAPETAPPVPDGAAAMPAASAGPSQTGPVTSMMADSADPAAVEQIRLDLLRGNRETAMWSAVDKRLWGHAMLISHTVSPDLYKQVAQEFVRKEVNFPGHKNESIAALYKVFSGNSDDCVDELVPIHARVGLQLVSKQSALEPTRDAVDGLDKWRETLTLILNNRSSDDVRGLNALGKLLSSYGRAEAAHICFIFSRNLSVFSGLDDPKADFVLLGSDHRQQSEHFAKETEALQLSEVYEYGLSLAGGAAATAGAPHIAAYKLQHAATLADYGNRDKVLQYCDAITSAMVSQTRRSHHHHAILEAAVDDFMTRLKQAPKDASSSWISKPSMNKVSDSVWNRFNRFVAGDEGDVAGNGAAGEGESGPFAHLTTIPNMSRSPSVSNFETYGAGSPGYAANPAPPPTSGASSRYASAPMQSAALGKPFSPTSQYTPASVSSGRASNEYSRNAYEPMHQGTNPSPTLNSNPYAPVTSTAVGAGSQPSLSDFSPGVPNGHGPSSVTQLPSAGGYQPLEPQGSPSITSPKVGGEATVYTPGQGYEPPTYGYEPQQNVIKVDDSQDGKDASGSGGFEPPSYQPYSYEPPSYHPDPEPSPEDGDEAPKPKKKSFMDDDEDDIPALRAATKSKAEKDRENEEMFRKAAEEDAKRAAAQQPAKKGWGFSGWFGGGGKKAAAGAGEASSPGKPIRAKLGEASSFVYDPDLKRWINKKPGAENTEAKKATPPPPPSSSTPPPAMTRSASHSGLASAPPGGPPGLSSGGPPSRPPSRPATSMSNASSIDDLLGVAATRKPGQKKPRKSGRYVDVMAK